MAPPDPQVVEKIRAINPNAAFVIHRSTNTNVVVYAGKLGPDGKLDSASPLDVHWIMFEKNGVREELNTIERNTAYGVSVKPASTAGEFEVVVSSLKDRTLLLKVEDGKAIARTVINGVQNSKIERIWVDSSSNMLGLPKVNFIELFGVGPDGSAVTEKKKP